MNVQGYGVEVEIADDALTATPTNRASKIALLGQDRKDGSVTIPFNEVADIAWKDASMMTNGCLTVTTLEGREYKLHFLKKHTKGFETLLQALPTPDAGEVARIRSERQSKVDAAREAAAAAAPGAHQIVCPHCQVRGHVTTRQVRAKKGVSGGKATGAVLTGGVSLLATGLSRKENQTEMHCGNCNMTWTA
jgi:hypothetical protein